MESKKGFSWLWCHKVLILVEFPTKYHPISSKKNECCCGGICKFQLQPPSRSSKDWFCAYSCGDPIPFLQSPRAEQSSINPMLVPGRLGWADIGLKSQGFVVVGDQMPQGDPKTSKCLEIQHQHEPQKAIESLVFMRLVNSLAPQTLIHLIKLEASEILRFKFFWSINVVRWTSSKKVTEDLEIS